MRDAKRTLRGRTRPPDAVGRSAAPGGAIRALLLFLLVACKSAPIAHQPARAAETAMKFARVAFVQHDASAAYALLSEHARNFIGPEKFAEAIAQMHPSSFPASLVASEFEPDSGDRSLSIFLYGESAGEKFYYRISVEAADTGYAVSGFYRGKAPYPPSAGRQKLSPPQSS